MTFLDKGLIYELRSKISGSPIFSKDVSLKDNYDLICAVLDRLDTSVNYLNKHSDIPSTEHDFWVFMMYSSMVKDASKQLGDVLGVDYPFMNKNDDVNFKFFKSFCMRKPLNLEERIVPTDDKFFEYFRSIAFAHPFETSRANFLKKNDNEIHYSPFVIVNDHMLSPLKEIKDAVGVRVYTNKADGWDSILDIEISFNSLKNFIESRYNFIKKIIDWSQKQIDDFEQIWKSRKVDRNLPDIKILEDIIEIFKSRHQSTYAIETILDYLECELTLDDNLESVKKYRSMIIGFIPAICDAVDNLDYDFIFNTIYFKIEATPKGNIGDMTSYQIQKIFSYESDVSWGRHNAKEFSQGFAKEFVTIKQESMNFSEIKLLVRTACYLKIEQEK